MELQRKDEEEFKRLCGLIKQAQSHSLLRLLKQIVKGNFLSNQPGLDKGSVVSRQMEDRG